MTFPYYHKATGIGSLPHRSTREAMNIIQKNLKSVPHWPQLPQRSPDENLIRQYLKPLVDANLISFSAAGTPFFVTIDPQWDSRSLSYLEMLIEAEENFSRAGETFAFPEDSASGFYNFLRAGWVGEGSGLLKGQVTGPLTLGFQTTDPGGNPAFYNDQLREILVKTLSLQARWQIHRLREPGKPVMIFIDEPMIYGYGNSAYVGLGKESIQQSLGMIAGAIREEKAFVGVHCCAGPDWSILLELPLDLVSFDAYNYLTSLTVYGDCLSSFLKGGGALAWGIVPTSPEVMDEDASSLWERLQYGITVLAGFGVDRKLLERQLIITPSCGTGTRPIELAERVYNLTGQLETKLDRFTL